MWGAGKHCPDVHTAAPDLFMPPFDNRTGGPGKRVRQTPAEFKHTQAYHGLYLPTDWTPASATDGKKYPVMVEYMANGPWSSTTNGTSSGLPGTDRWVWVRGWEGVI